MNKITFNQYREPVPGVFRPGEPKCPFIAAIPTLTVTNVEGLKGLADCLVHVTDNNTTYYIDDKHRVTITWAGPVEIDDYDYEANPKNIRSGEVWDFKNNRIIIYDAVGNYAVFAGSIDDFNQLRNRPKYAGQEMTGDTNIPDVAAIEAAVAGIDSAINKVVMTDLVLDANPSTTTVQLDSTKTNIKTSTSTTENIPLPVASTTQAGVMNSAIYNAVSHNTNDINALMNGAVAIAGISATPTQSDLTTAWESETGLSELMNRASIYDIDNDKIWTYYANTDTWYPSANTPSITINTFTNNSEGTIKGSTNVGQVFAENDGTGSVNGWDALSSTVADHTSQIASKVDESELADYATLNDVDENMSNTWQLIAEASVDTQTTGYNVCQVSIPEDWQGADIDYKFVLSLEHVGEDKEAFPYLRMQTSDGWEDFDFSYMRLTHTGNVETHQTSSRHCGFEWHVLRSYDSCVADGTISHPYITARYWNVSCHAGGISSTSPCTYLGGGRSHSGHNILGFDLYSSNPITWSAGTHLEIYARKKSSPAVASA